jgi:hypothetical protein
MILNVSLCPYYNAVHISCQQKYKPQYPHKSVRIISTAVLSQKEETQTTHTQMVLLLYSLTGMVASMTMTRVATTNVKHFVSLVQLLC